MSNTEAMYENFYTGVGSRDIPEPVSEMFYNIGLRLGQIGYCLRSGKALGSDEAFQKGAEFAFDKYGGAHPQVYTPWRNFKNPNVSDKFDIPLDSTPYQKEAESIAAQIHPAWNALKPDGEPVLKQGAKKLHTRNVYQVLGTSLDKPSQFLVCYAEPVGKSGKVKGGTNTAVAIALQNNVPVYNFWKQSDLLAFYEEVLHPLEAAYTEEDSE